MIHYHYTFYCFATHTLWHLVSIFFCLHEQLSFISKICKFKDPQLFGCLDSYVHSIEIAFMAPVEKCVSVLPYNTYMSQVPMHIPLFAQVPEKKCSWRLFLYCVHNCPNNQWNKYYSVHWNPPFQNPRSTTEWLNLQVAMLCHTYIDDCNKTTSATTLDKLSIFDQL